MINRKITPSEGGKRLHRFLRNLMPNIPLGQIYKMIDSGKVKVNGKRKTRITNWRPATSSFCTLRKRLIKRRVSVRRKRSMSELTPILTSCTKMPS